MPKRAPEGVGQRRALTATAAVASILFLLLRSPAGYAEEGIPDKGQVDFGMVRPILERACVKCHSPGQIAPMSLRTYREVRPWAKAIRIQVVNRTMPPFGGDGPIGKFINDPRLTDEEINTIVAWINSGGPPDSDVSEKDAAAEIRNTWSGAQDWPLGPPDIVLKMDRYEVKANDKDQYILHLIDEPFPEDMWVGSIDVRHKDPSVVHHANVHVVNAPAFVESLGKNPKQMDLIDAEMIVPGPAIFGWLPGMPPKENTPGFFLPKGIRMALSSHYAPRESPAAVESEIGFYAFTGVIDHIPRSFMDSAGKIDIKPGDPDYRLSKEEVFDRDVLIDAYNVHMHLRGKSSKVTLMYPDGRNECAFDISRFNFYWQRNYRLTRPILAPKGTRIRFEVHWDNSAGNPNNPDPNSEVVAGFRSEDEMWISALQYYGVRPDRPRMWIHEGKRVRVDDPRGDGMIWRENHYAL